MLAMTPAIADYTFKMFLTFHILQAGPLKCRRACVNLPPYSPSRSSCVR